MGDLRGPCECNTKKNETKHHCLVNEQPAGHLSVCRTGHSTGGSGARLSMLESPAGAHTHFHSSASCLARCSLGPHSTPRGRPAARAHFQWTRIRAYPLAPVTCTRCLIEIAAGLCVGRREVEADASDALPAGTPKATPLLVVDGPKAIRHRLPVDSHALLSHRSHTQAPRSGQTWPGGPDHAAAVVARLSAIQRRTTSAACRIDPLNHHRRT